MGLWVLILRHFCPLPVALSHLFFFFSTLPENNQASGKLITLFSAVDSLTTLGSLTVPLPSLSDILAQASVFPALAENT